MRNARFWTAALWIVCALTLSHHARAFPVLSINCYTQAPPGAVNVVGTNPPILTVLVPFSGTQSASGALCTGGGSESAVGITSNLGSANAGTSVTISTNFSVANNSLIFTGNVNPSNSVILAPARSPSGALDSIQASAGVSLADYAGTRLTWQNQSFYWALFCQSPECQIQLPSANQLLLFFNNTSQSESFSGHITGASGLLEAFAVAGRSVSAGAGSGFGNVGASASNDVMGEYQIVISGAPIPGVNPAVRFELGGKIQYSYAFTSLSGTGDVFIPVLDPSGLVRSSLPADATLITNHAAISADWPGSGNTILGGQSEFNHPAALLEVPEDGNSSLLVSFLDTKGPINGPVSADGLLLDPPVPGVNGAPEPATLTLFGLGLGGLSLYHRRRRRIQHSVSHNDCMNGSG